MNDPLSPTPNSPDEPNSNWPYQAPTPSLALQPPPVQSPLKVSIHTSITWLAHGVAMPAVLLFMSLSGMHANSDQEWQSGELKDYVGMLLKPTAWWVFTPAMFYSMASLATLSMLPDRADRLWVRMGIYTGVPLAIHFGVLLLLIYHGAMLVVAFFTWLIWHVVIYLTFIFLKPKRQFHIWHILVAMTVVALLVVGFRGVFYQILFLPIGAFFAVVMATPLLNIVAYTHAAVLLARSSRGKTTETFDQSIDPTRSKRFAFSVAIAAGWLITWLAGWRYAVIVMLDEYSKLPTTNPNCYLANAAAHAHPLLTGAKVRGQVTQGMRRLKFLELVLRAAAPQWHRRMRAFYDHYCPPLAAYCQQHYWLATLTCLALKPLELVAEIARIMLCIHCNYLSKIYSRSAE